MRNFPLFATEHIRDIKELADGVVSLYVIKDASGVLTGASKHETVTYGQFNNYLCALADSLIDHEFSGRTVAPAGINPQRCALSHPPAANRRNMAGTSDKERYLIIESDRGPAGPLLLTAKAAGFGREMLRRSWAAGLVSERLARIKDIAGYPECMV